jgi:probable F420-dependent oxidoreductase
MQLGVVFPQTEIQTDPGAIRAYAEAAEGLGYRHMLAFDHVLGADPAGHPGWSGRYSHRHMFHEPFVLFGFLAAVTKAIEFATSVLILGQRQTALVAKQAAEVDVLTGGRLRLGIGTGWNAVEYEALDMEFHDRGARSEEQIELMRALWTQEVVDFEGKWHKVTAAGINPLPVQRPIPVWIGGWAEPVIRRAARIADGLILASRDNPEQRAGPIQRMREYAREAGRDPDTLGLDCRANLADGMDGALAQAAQWQELGATHLSFNSMDSGLARPDDHIDAIRQFKEAMGPG